jgi:ClpP class serine protease
MSAPAGTRTRARYEGRGLLAIDPVAFGADYEILATAGTGALAPFELAGTAAVVDVCGPLESAPSWRWDSYPDVLARVRAACASAAVDTVVLRIASPGGDVAGCFESARAIRAATDAAGKTLIAYVTDRACSAAYALACVCSEICLSDSGIVGSIGVLSTREDCSERLAASGVRIALTASGTSKADGHPAQPITDGELARTQSLVDSMAAVFFALVRTHRGVDAQPLQAGVYHGTTAVAVGLADRVVSYTALLAEINNKDTTAMADEETPTQAARKMLQAIADGEDKDAAAIAKRALAAMDEKPKPKDEESDPGAEGDDSETAEHEEPDGDEAAESDEAKPAARASARGRAPRVTARGDSSALSMAAKAHREVHALRAELRARDEREQRNALLATRPDFSADYRAVLTKLPLTEVRELIRTTPRAPATDASAAAALAATRAHGTRGDATDTDSPVGHLPPAERAALDARMGLTAMAPGIRNTPFKLTLGEAMPVTAPPAKQGGSNNG